MALPGGGRERIGLVSVYKDKLARDRSENSAGRTGGTTLKGKNRHSKLARFVDANLSKEKHGGRSIDKAALFLIKKKPFDHYYSQMLNLPLFRSNSASHTSTADITAQELCLARTCTVNSSRVADMHIWEP